MPRVTCPECGERIGPDDPTFVDDDRRLLCESCREQDEENAATVTVTGPDGPTLYRLGNFARYADDDTDLRGLPSGTRTYHRTDGWRGYWTTTLTGFEVLADDWTTGWPDETTQRKADLNNLLESMFHGTERPPVLVAFTMDPTSNAFSTSLTIHVRPDDRQAAAEWFASHGWDEDRLARAVR